MDKPDYFQINRQLVDVAMGRKPADLVIRKGIWICVQSGEFIPDTDIAISAERIAYVGPDASHTIGEHTAVVEADGMYLSPGFLDGHMHIESGMLTITEFVRAVLPHGTTGMMVDPHEIANVFGLPGIGLMVDEAAGQPVHVWVQAPSCVPSAPGLETPGASLGAAEIREALSWNGVIGLGEMMDYPGVINGNEKTHQILAETHAARKIIGGHYASPDLGLPFHGYAAGGATDDHEGTRMEDAIARVRQGMRAMLRFGSAWHDVAEGIRAILEGGLDSRQFILCTDDAHSGTLVSEGHVNRAIHQAILGGLPAMTALQMATINTAEYFRVSDQVGMIAPGRFADICVLKELHPMKPHLVIAKGKLAARDGELLLEIPSYPLPNWAKDAIHLKQPVTAEDFQLKTAQRSNPRVNANVIGVIENQAPTKHLQMTLTITNGEVKSNIKTDLAKVALVERHSGSGKIQVGLVHGFGFNCSCAVASTVAHDCHHLIVAGTDESDMAVAVNELARIGGGQVVVKEGQIIGKVALPVAGLMSNERAETVAQQANTILSGFRSCGCTLNNPNMQLSLLALAVIPELRITDLGLVDVGRFEIIPVLQD